MIELVIYCSLFLLVLYFVFSGMILHAHAKRYIFIGQVKSWILIIFTPGVLILWFFVEKITDARDKIELKKRRKK